jgi:hypothetical protein
MGSMLLTMTLRGDGSSSDMSDLAALAGDDMPASVDELFEEVGGDHHHDDDDG